MKLALKTISMKKLLLLIALMFNALFIWAQAPNTQSVIDALETGSASDLVALCIPNLDLDIMGKDDVYSRAQAEQILKKFFGIHKPSNFSTEHNGVSKTGDHYVIGKLSTSGGDKRVTFFQKKVGDQFLVKQLRIEASRKR